MSRGMQPVRFQTSEMKYDFTCPFTVAMWGYYITKMYGKPSLRADTSQKVLKYLHSQPSLVVKSWRSRLYRFSSASLFAAVGEELKEWVAAEDVSDVAERETKKSQRVIALRKVKDVDNLYSLLGDTIYQFMRLKATPFPNAFNSKKDFMEIPAWQRALIFVHLYRYVLEKPANKQ